MWISKWRKGWTRWQSDRIRPRLTADGMWFLLLLGGVMIAAVNTGNNLVYLSLAGMCAGLMISNGLAEWNLRGLTVERRLPLELYAGRAATGAFVVTNHRPIGASRLVWIRDVDARAEGLVVELGPGATIEVPAHWCCPNRGWLELSEISMGSRFPFGLVERTRVLRRPARVVVFPTPLPGAVDVVPINDSGGLRDTQRAGDGDEFRGLREYAVGDPLSRVHWPTTARVGHPMLVERRSSANEQVVVRVSDVSGDALELELSHACWAIVRQSAAGHAVALEFAGQRTAARQGDSWRRTLLCTLAFAASGAA